MANFGQLILTNLGIQEQYKAQLGAQMKFKRIGMGSGQFSGNAAALTKLVAENVSVSISNGYANDTSYTVEGFFSNDGLQTGFAWREIGLFVEDQSGNEILYAYANAGDSYDYIPATEDERYSKYIRIATAIGNATNVSIVENEGIIYVDTVTFKALKEDVDNLWPSKEVSGESIVILESAELPFVKMQLFGKTEQVKTTGAQLFDSSVSATNGNHDSITISEDGYKIVAVGGATYGYTFTRYPLDITKFVGKTVTLKAESITGTYDKCRAMLYGFIDGTAKEIAVLTKTTLKVTVTVPEDITEIYMYIYNNSSGTVLDANDTVTVKGLIASYDADAEWEPYTGTAASPSVDYPQELNSVAAEEGQIECSVHGAQLFDTTVSIGSNSNTSINITEDGYSIVAVGGTANIYAFTTYPVDIRKVVGKTLTVKADSITMDQTCSRIMICAKIDGELKNLANLTASILKATFVVPENATNFWIYVYTNTTGALLSTSNTITIKGLMLSHEEYGDCEWEPYKEQSIILSANELAGIPVSSDGNYTDESGQQWICDEIDLERGVLVQRIKKVAISSLGTPTFYSVTQGNLFRFSVSDVKQVKNASEKPSLLCDSYICTSTADRENYTISMAVQYNAIDFMNNDYTDADEFKDAMNAVTVAYALATPIETQLTDEEIAAYKALYSNNPNTTIFNDAGAGMTVEYVSKAYDGALGRLWDDVTELKEDAQDTVELAEGLATEVKELNTEVDNLNAAVATIPTITLDKENQIAYIVTNQA